jgi:hypothetical protein
VSYWNPDIFKYWYVIIRKSGTLKIKVAIIRNLGQA